jgi:hypothetical protein
MKVLHNQAPQSAITDLFKVLEEDLGKKVSIYFSINLDLIEMFEYNY